MNPRDTPSVHWPERFPIAKTTPVLENSFENHFCDKIFL
jgi:hypothetical protein